MSFLSVAKGLVSDKYWYLGAVSVPVFSPQLFGLGLGVDALSLDARSRAETDGPDLRPTAS